MRSMQPLQPCGDYGVTRATDGSTRIAAMSRDLVSWSRLVISSGVIPGKFDR